MSCLILSDAPDLGVPTRWIDLPSTVPNAATHAARPRHACSAALVPPAKAAETLPGVQPLHLPTHPRAARNLAAGDVAQSPLFQSHVAGGIFIQVTHE
jgi:hypothetical protein